MIREGGQRQLAPRKFADRAQAEKWLRLKRAEVESGAILLATPERESLTFAEYAPEQIDSLDLKPRTRALYERQLGLYAAPVLGGLRLSDITPAMVRERWREFNSKTPTARAHAYALLKSVLAAAMTEAPPLIDANPCRIRGAGKSRRVRCIRPATTEELAVTVEAMPDRRRQALLFPIRAAGSSQCRRWIGTGTRPGTRRVGQTCASTICATRKRYSPPPVAPRSPS